MGVIIRCLADESLGGPVNVVTPHPVTNREFTKSLGNVLHRPTLFPMPAPLARIAFGEMTDALILASARVAPGRLNEHGYAFQHATIDDAFRHLFGQ